MPKFFTKYVRPAADNEIGDETLIVERAGYVPAKKQIENLIFSGQRLREIRAEQFDGVTDEEAEENYDPTRDSDFDLADYSRVMSELERKAEAARAAKGSVGDKTGSTSESVSVEGKTGEEA